MKINSIEYSNVALFYFLIVGLLLFIIFRFLQISARVWKRKKRYRKAIRRFLPVSELAVYILYFIIALQYLVKTNRMFAWGAAVVLVVLLAIVTWFSLRDVIAGIIFRTSYNFSLKDSIYIGSHKGKINKIGLIHLVIETDSGESIFLPFSRVLSDVIIKAHPAETILSHTFRVEIPKALPWLETMENIKNEIIHLPWSSIKKSPNIKPVAEGANTLTLEIIIFALEKDYFYKIEHHIRTKFATK